MQEQERTASVYGLEDERVNEIFYIGMSVDPYSRYGEHLSLRTATVNKAKNERILDMRKDGLMPRLIIIESDIPIEDAHARECYWMQHYKRVGAPLTNTIMADYLKPSKVKKSPVHDENIDETFIDCIGETWLTAGQVSRRLSVPCNRLANLTGSGYFHAYKLGTLNLYKLSEVSKISVRTEKYVPLGRAFTNPDKGSRGAIQVLDYLEAPDGSRWICSTQANSILAANNGKDNAHNLAESLTRRGLLQSCRIGKYNLYNLQQVQNYRYGNPGRHRFSDDQLSPNALRQRKFKARRRSEKLAQVQLQTKIDPSQLIQGTLF